MHLTEHAGAREKKEIPVLLMFICAVYALGAFLLRYPLVDVITDAVGVGAIYDPMEPVYLLMARDVVTGYLPYQQHWGEVAPLGWVIAAFYWVVGGGVVGARVLTGVTMVAVAVLLERTGREMGRAFMGWLAGVFYILAASLLPLSHSFGLSVPGALLVVMLMRMTFAPRVSVYGFACAGAALVMLQLEGVLLVGALAWCAGRQGANSRTLMTYMLLVLGCANAVLLGWAWLVGVQEAWLTSLRMHMLPAFSFSTWLDRGHAVWVVLLGVYIVFVTESLVLKKLEKLDVLHSVILAAALAAIVLGGGDVAHVLRCVMLYLPVFVMVMARVMMLEMRDLRPFFMIVTMVGIWHASVLLRQGYAARLDGEEAVREKELFSERTVRIADMLHGKFGPGDGLVDCSGASMLHVLTGAQYTGYVMMPVAGDIRRVERALGLREGEIIIAHDRVKAVVAGERDPCLMRAAGELKAHYELIDRIYGSVVYVRHEEEGAEAPELSTP